MSGRLFVIATPIGNLSDISKRAIDILSAVDWVLAEDTRVSLKLLNHLGLKKKLKSCHEFNERTRTEFLESLSSDDASVALISDAGTPLVSDPGHLIVEHAIAIDMDVIPVPGPSAFLLALVGSGLPCDRFVFEGFLPQRKRERRARLEQLAVEERTMVFYIAPHDLLSTMDEICANFGNRQACLARELTKKFEEFLRGDLNSLREQLDRDRPPGEYVLIVAGAMAPEPIQHTEETIVALLRKSLHERTDLKAVAQRLAKQTGWSRSDIYKLGLAVLEDSLQ